MFLYAYKEQSEKKTNNAISFIIAYKRIKYLWIAGGQLENISEIN
jgi:hypothetical protein